MKYRVTINQKLKYNETIVGEFNNLTEVQTFIETVIAHFEKASIGIEVITGEEGADE